MKSVRSVPKSIKRMAVAHMIGQMQDMLLAVKTSDVAAWLGCTKPTARQYLEQMERNGLVHKRVENWRGESNVHYWKLTEGAFHMYKHYAYGLSYEHIVSIRIGK